jgi:peptide/nickel transport system ATP-binding protein/oligopeptide transport system ATP-binding protein
VGVLLDIRNLVVRFYTQEGIVYAVNDVGYTLHEGETLGIVGESGSGKSVHALAMMGLIPSPPGKVESGEVIFEGRDLLKLSNEQMRLVRGKEIAMIFQDPMTSLNPVLTIGTQLTESLKLHLGMNQSQANKRAAELLDLVGIPDAAKRLKDYPHQFSGGMRQRVMIAIGLSCNPKLLIADEPTTALDVTIQAQILELVKQLKKEFNMAMIWITHDLGVVAELADNIQVMYAGRIVERGPTKEVFGDPRNAYTLGLMRSLPDHNGARTRLTQIEGAPPDMRIPPKGDAFAVRNKYATERCFEEQPPLLPVQGGSSSHLAAAWYDLRAEIAKERAAATAEGVK